jgi:hypothetical protein
MKDRGVSFKTALNDAIRAGLGRRIAPEGRRFVQKSFSLGPVRNFNWDKALTVAEAIEDEDLSRNCSQLTRIATGKP